ncbi:MAG TPA: glycine cleavage system aminomethyltransferase GcvT, partial [Kineosporiaceae bacterium]
MTPTRQAGESTPPSGPRHTPLYERHVALGAKLADFGGWEMPIEYPGGGVLREHEAVRSEVGLFDVSHLGKLSIRGPGAAAFVDATLSNSLGRISPGRAQYTLCLDDATGGVVDDLIAYLRADDDVLLVPNAANSAEVGRRLAAAAPPAVTVTDEHADLGVLAVQGPRSDDVLADLGLPHGHEYLSFVDTQWAGQPVVVCRTGYTGERGYELVPSAAAAPALWDALLARVIARGGVPAGLGARDTLRTEMGYPLHGHELTLRITPVQARLGWAVGWRKPEFWGRAVLITERERGAARLSWGLLAL